LTALLRLHFRHHQHIDRARGVLVCAQLENVPVPANGFPVASDRLEAEV
jgi:hypothetical protein